MKKILTLAFIVASMAAHSQNINKVDDKINGTNYTIDKTSNTINSTESEIDKIGGLFKHKKKKEDQPVATAPATPVAPAPQAAASTAKVDTGLNTTVIIFNKCDFSSMRDMLTLLGTCPDVKSTDKTYSNNTAVITVKHSRSTDNILDFVSSTTEKKYDISAFDKGSITLSLSPQAQGQK